MGYSKSYINTINCCIGRFEGMEDSEGILPENYLLQHALSLELDPMHISSSFLPPSTSCEYSFQVFTGCSVWFMSSVHLILLNSASLNDQFYGYYRGCLTQSQANLLCIAWITECKRWNWVVNSLLFPGKVLWLLAFNTRNMFNWKGVNFPSPPPRYQLLALSISECIDDTQNPMVSDTRKSHLWILDLYGKKIKAACSGQLRWFGPVPDFHMPR